MKRSLLRIPIIAGFAKLAGYVPYGETAEVLSYGREILNAGGDLIIFPEGTRSPENSLGPFHRGAMRLAIESRVPVVVFGLFMRPVVFGKRISWWKPPTQVVKYRVEKLLEFVFESDGNLENFDKIRNECLQQTKRLEDRLNSWLTTAEIEDTSLNRQYDDSRLNRSKTHRAGCERCT